MVRCEINCIGRRKIVVCCMFSDNYPATPILLELKSKTLSDELIKKLSKAANTEVDKLLMKPQLLHIIKFLKKFLVENTLSVCYDEITTIKKLLGSKDEIKLKRKASTIFLTIVVGAYFLKVVIKIPEEYSIKPASILDAQSNFPDVMENYLLAQCNVIGRQCSEPPSTRLVKFKDGKVRPVAGKIVKAPASTTFKEKPSLEKIVTFLVTTCRIYVSENCQVCQKQCLPDDPKAAQLDANAADHVERVYCGHLFHLSCLIAFMKTPPFQGGKKCGACEEVISHDKWRLSERQAEERWAHEQARDRELQEVAEFFG